MTYAPSPVTEEVAPEILALAEAAVASRLALYVGAGISVGTPALLPTSSELIDRISEEAELHLGIPRTTDSGTPRTLEQMADDAESDPAKLEEFKRIASRAADFENINPNFEHKALAALLREGLVTVFSVNWDMGIERGGAWLGSHFAPAVTDSDSLLGPATKFRKVHGCATRPETLMVTNAEVDAPPPWAAAEVQAALSGGEVVFLGLGTVGDYVRTRIQHIVDVARGVLTFRVASRSLSDAWRELLGEDAEQRYIAGDANAFLDELLRAVVRLLIGRIRAHATALVGSGSPPSATLQEDVARLTDALMQLDALSFLRFVRDGAQGISDGEPVVVGDRALSLIVAAAVVTHDHEPRAVGRYERATLETNDSYVELLACPLQPAATMVKRELARSSSRREAGVYADVGKPVVHLCFGSHGPLPSEAAIDDLIGQPKAGDLLDVGGGGTHRWIAAEQVLQSQAAA